MSGRLVAGVTVVAVMVLYLCTISLDASVLVWAGLELIDVPDAVALAVACAAGAVVTVPGLRLAVSVWRQERAGLTLET